MSDVSSPHRAGLRDSHRTCGDLVAVVFAALDRDVVARSTVAAHLSRVGVDPSGENLRQAIRHLESKTWVRREHDYVRMLDLAGVRAWLARTVVNPEHLAGEMVSIAKNCGAQKAKQEGAERGRTVDDENRRGISDLVALALVTLDLSVVRRSTIRSLCPGRYGTHHATGEPTKGRVQTQINRAYRRFELKGWVHRDGDYIRVLDRTNLRSWVAQGVDASPERALTLLNVEETARQINADLESGKAVPGWTAEEMRRNAEIRRQELLALKRLMECGPGAAHPGGSRSVRIVPRGRVL